VSGERQLLMLQLERQTKIMAVLAEREAVSVADLSEQFDVSQNTVRRDLLALKEKGFLSITHGGAVWNKEASMGLPLQQREVSDVHEKRMIGAIASRLIADGESIILDAGTTTEQIAKSLKKRTNLTVITNAFNVAMELTEYKGITLVMIGGIYNHVTGCLAGFHAEKFLSEFHVHKAFLSAGGVTPESITNTNAFEVQIKRSMMTAAQKVYLVVTHQKLDTLSLVPFAQTAQLRAIITDPGADPEILDKFRTHGIEVMTC
jgi:DeoR family fructose operon transcriptional repressor